MIGLVWSELAADGSGMACCGAASSADCGSSEESTGMGRVSSPACMICQKRLRRDEEGSFGRFSGFSIVNAFKSSSGVSTGTNFV
jgi:hypothetical protein